MQFSGKENMVFLPTTYKRKQWGKKYVSIITYVIIFMMLHMTFKV